MAVISNLIFASVCLDSYFYMLYFVKKNRKGVLLKYNDKLKNKEKTGLYIRKHVQKLRISTAICSKIILNFSDIFFFNSYLLS